MVVEAVRWVDSMAYIRRLNPSTMTMFREQLLWGSIAVLMLTGVGAYSVWVYFINDEQANDLPLVTTEVATRKTALYYVVEFSADNGACGTYYLTNTTPGSFTQESVLAQLEKAYPDLQHPTITGVFRFNRAQDVNAYDSATAVLLSRKK
jgi:hypothetical protein